tara:strand:+ start:16 stop:390 length:375 start_codon:yes stop_codon:yes gene_type:complete
MLNIISVSIGGLIGVLIRYGIIQVMQQNHFTVRTIVANALGCLLLGSIIAGIQHVELPDHIRLGIIVGCCGALTTFSTIIYDIVTLLSQEQFTQAVYYFVLTNIAGIGMFGVGFIISAFLYKQF